MQLEAVKGVLCDSLHTGTMCIVDVLVMVIVGAQCPAMRSAPVDLPSARADMLQGESSWKSANAATQTKESK